MQQVADEYYESMFGDAYDHDAACDVAYASIVPLVEGTCFAFIAPTYNVFVVTVTHNADGTVSLVAVGEYEVLADSAWFAESEVMIADAPPISAP